MIKLASCQYAIPLITSWDNYAHHLAELIDDAATQGADLLLLPEYAGLALAGQLDDAARIDLVGSISGIQSLIPNWLALCEKLAQKHKIILQPGTVPVRDPDGQYRNRAWLFGPEGMIGHQDKQIMTRFEREQWGIAAGVEGLRTFQTAIGKLGILVCYDNEFPMLGRKLCELGAVLVLAPSCTDTPAGSYRVRIGAQARALENQYAVLSSPTAGKVAWSPALDENHGRAALYVPSDYGMPASGIFAESPSNTVEKTSWLIVDIDLADVTRLRTEGQVTTHRDWPEQF